MRERQGTSFGEARRSDVRSHHGATTNLGRRRQKTTSDMWSEEFPRRSIACRVSRLRTQDPAHPATASRMTDLAACSLPNLGTAVPRHWSYVPTNPRKSSSTRPNAVALPPSPLLPSHPKTVPRLVCPYTSLVTFLFIFFYLRRRRAAATHEGPESETCLWN